MEHAVIQAILRSYGSSQHQSLQINAKVIAARSGTTAAQVMDTLKLLAQYDLAYVDLQPSDTQMTFLVPREDNRTINRFKKDLETHLELKRAKLRSMIEFVNEKDKCLNNVLLAYFGEVKKKNCGRCSNCRRKEERINHESSTTRILHLLQQRPMNIAQLSDSLNVGSEELITLLRVMLDSKRVVKTHDQRFSINE